MEGKEKPRRAQASPVPSGLPDGIGLAGGGRLEDRLMKSVMPVRMALAKAFLYDS